MSVTISANAQSITIPPPEVGESYRLLSEVIIHRMSDDSVTSYVRKRNFRVWSLEFVLTRSKSLEFYAFVKNNSKSVWSLSVDDIRGILITNPIEFSVPDHDFNSVEVEIRENTPTVFSTT